MTVPADVSVAILCGGLGTRLGALAAEVPKPLVPVLGRPFLEYQVDLLARFGFRRFVFLTGHRGDLVAARLSGYRPAGGAEAIEAAFSREATPLGTGGALVAARERLSDPFFLVNGDSYLDVDYAAMLRAFEVRGAVGSKSQVGLVAAWRNPEPSAGVEANNLALGDDDVVLLYEKRGADPRLLFVDAGAGLYRRSVLDFAAGLTPPFSLEEDVWPRAIAHGALGAFRVVEAPRDIGTPERLAAFSAWVESRAGAAEVRA